MALKLYNVRVNNLATVLQLNEADAKARGLADKDLYKPGKSPAAAAAEKAAAEKAAADKAAAEAAEKEAADKAAADAAAAEKAAADKAAADAKAAGTPANKSRAAAANK